MPNATGRHDRAECYRWSFDALARGWYACPVGARRARLGLLLLVPGLSGCARDRPLPPSAAAEAVRPTVIAPRPGPDGDAIRIAALFPTIGRYAASGRQS